MGQLWPRVPGQDSGAKPSPAPSEFPALGSGVAQARAEPGVRILCQTREGLVPPGSLLAPPGTLVPSSCSHSLQRERAGPVLSDSPAGALSNLLFPNLFSFSRIQSSLCFQGSKNIIQLRVHTRGSAAQQMPAEPLVFRGKEEQGRVQCPLLSPAGLPPPPWVPPCSHLWGPAALSCSQGEQSSWRP